VSEYLTHPLDPFFDGNSKILILGSFPSIKSREQGFYYQHPQNRFWRILEALYDLDKGFLNNITSQKAFLKKQHIALWDVLKSCKIKNSDDKTITYAQVNDLSIILDKAPIQKIIITGKKGFEIFQKYQEKKINSYKIEILNLPSTSPANLNFSFESLLKEYVKIKI